MYKLFFFLFVVLLLNSCGQHNGAELDDTEAVTIDLSNERAENSMDSIVTSVSCVHLKTDKSSKLSGIQGIRKITTVNGILYVLDKQFASIRAFDANGKYLFEVGGIGITDDKFLKVEDFAYNPNRKTLWVLCNTPKKLSEFSLRGKFIRNISMNFFASSVGFIDADKLCYFINQNETDLSGKKNLLLTDTTNNVDQRFFDFPKGINAMIEFTGGIYQTNDKVFFNPPFEPKIYQLSRNKISQKYKINFGPEDVSKPLFQRPYLGTSFVEAGDYVGFNYKKKGIYQLSFYNKKTKKVFTTNPALSPLNFLFSSDVFSQYKDTLTILLEAKYLQTALKINEPAFKNKFPGVYEQLIESDSTSKAATDLVVMKLKLKNY
jgi:hypothetical protein